VRATRRGSAHYPARRPVAPRVCAHGAARLGAARCGSASAREFVEEAVLCTVTSIVFAVVVFFGCDLQGSFWVFVGTYYLVTMIGIVLAYAVAAAVPTMEAANALLPTYVTLCMYFGGLFLTFDKIPPGWRWYVPKRNQTQPQTQSQAQPNIIKRDRTQSHAVGSRTRRSSSTAGRR
jgi:hypothetical protein